MTLEKTYDTRVSIPLTQHLFGSSESVIATCGDLVASGFRYSSGIEALRLKGPRSEIVLLPFFGHQIWRAAFDGRDVTMGSMFDEPVRTTRYLETYGAFFIHCGLTGLGDPGPKDKHPLHGELPLAPFSSGQLTIRPSEGRMEATGTYHHRVAFSANFLATSRIAINTNAAAADISLTVRNRRNTPMDLLYLGHANFRPVDGGVLDYTAHYRPADVAVRTSIPSHISPPDGYSDLINRLARDPKLHHKLDASLRFDPEVVFTMKMQADADGWAHGMQTHPDGTADFISYDTRTLPMATRWICRTDEQQGLGMVMPATSGVEGYSVEKAAGRVTEVPASGNWSARMRVGRLDRDAAGAMRDRIDKICERNEKGT